MTGQVKDVPMAISAMLITALKNSNEQQSTTIKISGLPKKLVTGQVKDVPMAISAVLITALNNSNEQ